ncbi:uncharacterized protein LOC126843883 [Adelges cooleyi]|uniref:uncharacterized protein LOC126843883 n=1 Tax=Adelges cooleyi TaxID=133065 RepID=UPI0021801C1C|nr:uncharacterized protein LOC126843883 [Adelges cooleyi]
MRQEMISKVALRPTATEITVALSESDVFRDIQVEHLQPFFYGGQYSVDFIQLLNTYKTLSSDPIELSSDEIAILTSNYNDDSKTNRILTQFKFCRKMQEIQCTNILLLKFSLPKVKSSLKVIADYVYNMIEMSYRGKFLNHLGGKTTPEAFDHYAIRPECRFEDLIKLLRRQAYVE